MDQQLVIHDQWYRQENDDTSSREQLLVGVEKPYHDSLPPIRPRGRNISTRIKVAKRTTGAQ